MGIWSAIVILTMLWSVFGDVVFGRGWKEGDAQ